MDILDTKTHLICFENGVYDLNSRRFRDGRPDDYITFTTRIDYIDYDECGQNICDVNSFLSKVFARDELRTYVLKLLASFLHGDMINQHFHIWTGSGSNGKSTIVDLIEGTLGDYSCPLPVSLLTKARSSSGVATPEFAKHQGKALRSHHGEPENGDQIYVGHMKEITGGDAMTVRGLYESPINITPQFSLVLCCDDLPQIPATDGGTWRRIRPVLFGASSWTRWTPKSNFSSSDPTITSRVKSQEWHEAFASILIKKVRRIQGPRHSHSRMRHEAQQRVRTEQQRALNS